MNATHGRAGQRARLLRVPLGTSPLAKQGRQGVVDMGGRQLRQRDIAQFTGGQAEEAAIDCDRSRAAIAAGLELANEGGEESSGRELPAADAAAFDRLF